MPGRNSENGTFRPSTQAPAHEFCEYLPVGIRRYVATQHTITNVAIELRGDEAWVETYVTACHYFANEEGQGAEMTYLGRYLDRMVKRGDVWKITHRRAVMDWNRNADATAVLEGPPFDGLARGSRHPDDPLYEHLG